ARDSFERALAMCQRLYPPKRYPAGHRLLATSLNNLAAPLTAQGEYGRARDSSEKALEMYQGLAEVFADASSEAEALNLLASLPETQSIFFSVTARLPQASQGEPYRVLWRGKAAVASTLQRRQQLLRGLTDPGARQRAEELLAVRRQLARLLLAPADGRTQD